MKNYFILFISLFLFNCNDFNTFRENKIEDKTEAEKTTNNFYFNLKRNKKNEIFKLFSNKFYIKTNKKDLNQFLDWAIKEGKSNSLQNNLINWHTLVIEGTSPKSEYTLVYKVKRGSLETEEIFNLEKENESIKIVGYKINAIIPNK